MSPLEQEARDAFARGFVARQQAHRAEAPIETLRLREVAAFLVSLAVVFVFVCLFLATGPVPS